MDPSSDSTSDHEENTVHYYFDEDEDEAHQQQIDADNDICSVFGILIYYSHSHYQPSYVFNVLCM